MQVGAVCDEFMAEVQREGVGRRPVVAFTHGHLSRILTARMLNLPAAGGASLWNDTATVGVINEHRGKLVLVGWNLRARTERHRSRKPMVTETSVITLP